MNDKKEEYEDFFVRRVAKYLRARGYEIATPAEIQLYEHGKAIGILKPAIEKKRFHIFRREEKQRSLHIGTLWFKTIKRYGGTQSVLNIHEREHIPELVELAVKLSKRFSMDIQLFWTEKIKSPSSPHYVLRSTDTESLIDL